MTKEADGYFIRKTKEAEGNYEQRVKRAEAEATSLKLLIDQYNKGGSKAVMKMRLNEEYIDNIKCLSGSGNSIIVKNDMSNIALNSNIASAVLGEKI